VRDLAGILTSGSAAPPLDQATTSSIISRMSKGRLGQFHSVRLDLGKIEKLSLNDFRANSHGSREMRRT